MDHDASPQAPRDYLAVPGAYCAAEIEPPRPGTWFIGGVLIMDHHTTKRCHHPAVLSELRGWRWEYRCAAHSEELQAEAAGAAYRAKLRRRSPR